MHAFEYLRRVTDARYGSPQRLTAARGFAQELRWSPTYEFEYSAHESARTHVVVEHGVEQPTVFTFIDKPYSCRLLSPSALTALLSVSYNNLIDWHIFVSVEDALVVHNRTFPRRPLPLALAPDAVERLASDNFDALTVNLASPTLGNCEDEIISLVRRWKTTLFSEEKGVTNRHISNLFNYLFFLRGAEDHRQPPLTRISRLLLDLFDVESTDILEIGKFAEKELGLHNLEKLIDRNALSKFSKIPRELVYSLLSDLYRTSNAPYHFDFALMSKHALSRIYERYVVELRDSPQASLFDHGDGVEIGAKPGVVYTPQFVASFFSRFVLDRIPLIELRSAKVLDPAAGSGIFLRTFLEHISNPLRFPATVGAIEAAFDNVRAIDVDPNACDATKLSLSLLHLIATGKLPENLNVAAADSISRPIRECLRKEKYQIVFMNPPYISQKDLTEDQENVYKDYLGEHLRGKIDAYLAFVKLALDVLAEGGLACMVLPQAFLAAQNAAQLRQEIATNFWIRCLADLSEVPVFEEVGIYNVLLVVQRQRASAHPPNPVLLRARGRLGQALQAALDERAVEASLFSVHLCEQTDFSDKEWYVLPPRELRIKRSLERLPLLSEFLDVHQGVVTGADEVFIRPRSRLKSGEEAIYVPLLTDREMLTYRCPETTASALFYPYIDGTAITETQLKQEFPETWKHLNQHKPALSSRYAVRKRRLPWWRPENPRSPDKLLRRKIICPHLMLTPRFALDVAGKYAVSRSPFAVTSSDGDEETFPFFFTAVLNSKAAFWYLSRHTFK